MIEAENFSFITVSLILYSRTVKRKFIAIRRCKLLESCDLSKPRVVVIGSIKLERLRRGGAPLRTIENEICH